MASLTAKSIMDIAETWCNNFGEEQVKDMLHDKQSKIKLQFIIVKAIKESWKLIGDQEDFVLMKDNAKFVLDIKIMTKNNVIVCVYHQSEYEIAAILANTHITVSFDKAHIITKHHDEE